MPTGILGGTPTGRPTPVGARQDEAVRRSLRRENDAAIVLAAHGYRIHQNPTAQQIADARARTGDHGRLGSEPDYLIEGRVFDCYAPKHEQAVRGVWKQVSDKVVLKDQTQRVVINLQDWGGDLGALRQQFAGWPIIGLKEVKAVTPDRHVVDLWYE